MRLEMLSVGKKIAVFATLASAEQHDNFFSQTALSDFLILKLPQISWVLKT